MIKKGKKYSTDSSDIFVLVHKIFYSNSKYIKASISLVHKRIKNIYETKTYKLYRKHIEHWREYVD